ncbi:MAG: sugar kinase [Enterococcus devriesei]|uniref:sugar kinase n=1 Tax=Enterococcus devriesei TaxID=319970 RepID=UPI003F90ECFB
MRFAAFGEVMLRLTPPESFLLDQTNELRMDYTGTGVNIMANLAQFNYETFLVTVLPDNRLGQVAKSALMKYGIRPNLLHFAHQHIGSYFAENGFGQRPTQVTYQNRHHSSFGVSDSTAYDFEAVVEGSDLIHICGISLSLTNDTRNAAHELAKKAAQAGKKVCFDFNFRPSLNTEPNKFAFMKKQYEMILPYCDIVFGSTRDLTELLQMEKVASEEALIREFMENYQVECFAGTKRTSEKNQKQLQGFLYNRTEQVVSQRHELTILDRIGAGDAYAAGILAGYAESWPLVETVEFATMNAILAHTIHGDVPLTTKEQVLMVLKNPGIDLLR